MTREYGLRTWNVIAAMVMAGLFRGTMLIIATLYRADFIYVCVTVHIRTISFS